MINKTKVRLMTRTAMYETHSASEDLPKAKYYRGDYIGLNVWITAIATTVAYILMLILVIAVNFEEIIENITRINYPVIIGMLITVYVAMMALSLIAAYIVYNYRYSKAEDGINRYRRWLHKIFLMNKADRKRNSGGGTL